MKKRTKTQNNAQELFTLMTDMELWNFLVRSMKKSHKVSRVQAFADLLDRQRIALLEKQDDDNLKGSIQDMAATWGWSRKTVSCFLDNLERFGVLTISRDGSQKTFRLTYEIKSTPNNTMKKMGTFERLAAQRDDNVVRAAAVRECAMRISSRV